MTPFDDDAIDALLAGTARGGTSEGLASFIEELRSAVGPIPAPSHALAAAIAAGGIAVFQPRFARLRMLRARLQGFVNGLGAAGKAALGIGVATAAIAGAAELGILPGPVQHAVSNAIGAVTPFSPPDPGGHAAGPGNLAGGGTSTTTTTFGAVTTTTVPVERSHDGNGAVVTPTTGGAQIGDGGGTTTTTLPGGEGSGGTPTTVPGGGAGSGNTTTTVPGGDGSGNTTTTVPGGDGSGNTTTTVPSSGTVKFLSIHCALSSAPVGITCTWSASTSPDHAHYVLWRTGDGNGRVVLETENALTFTDTAVVPGTAYGYRVSSLRADGSVDAHSALFRVECCGSSTGTTPTITYPGTTTPTTVHRGHGKTKP